MNTQKSLLGYFVDAYDRYRADRRSASEEEATPQPRRRGRVRGLLRWLTPNGGTLLLIALLVLTQNVWAWRTQAPAAPGPSATTVNYQGRLADSEGNPENGIFSIAFAIYDDGNKDAGNRIWGPEEHGTIKVTNGLFSVGLGSETNGGIPTTTWNGDRYLEITVDGEILEPRELIRSVPIAGMALTVPDGSVNTEKLGPDVNLVLIQSGRVHRGYTDQGWNLDIGSDTRTYDVPVIFTQSFSSVPNVQVSLARVDLNNDQNFRLDVSIKDITKNGFTIVYKTWSETKVYGATVSWIAYADQ